jgi:hypothetical protein
MLEWVEVRRLAAASMFLAVICVGCGGGSSPTAESVPASKTANPTVAMMRACEAAGRGYKAVPIAAFPNPEDADTIVCWADGHVFKSPPPSPGGSVPADFDRLVYNATTGGAFVTLIAAGYRDQLSVSPP